MKFFGFIILLTILINFIVDVKSLFKGGKKSPNNKSSNKEHGGYNSEYYRIIYEERPSWEHAYNSFRVEEIAKEILSGEWQDENITYDDPDAAMDIYPWDEFAYTMLRNPDSVKFDFDKCPICDNERFQIYHQELKNEEKEEYEENGQYVLICPKCKKYFGYELPKIRVRKF